MTVSTTTSLVSYTGNGATTEFPVPFKFLDDADLRVSVDGIVQTFTTDYSVTGAGDESGGTVSMLSAPDNGDTVLIERVMTPTQSVDLITGGAFRAQTHEDVFDRLTMLVQQLYSDMIRALKLEPGVAIDQSVYGSASDRAGKTIAFDDDGNAILATLASLTTAIPVTTFAESILNDVDELSVRETIGLGNASLGVQPSGSTINVEITKSITGNVSGTTDFRNNYNSLIVEGNNNAAQTNLNNNAIEIRTNSGDVTFAHVNQSYLRLGLSGSVTGNVVSARAYDAHIANEGSGTITEAFDYYANDVDLIDGTGTIGNIYAFRAGNQGHATRVTGSANGFYCGDMTGGAPITAAFRSLMSAGSGKWANYYSGSAESYYAGRMRINSSAQTGTVNGQPFVAIEGGGATALALSRSTNDAGGTTMALRKTRSTLPSGVTIVQNNDIIGTFSFEATDGNNPLVAASIRAVIDGTPGANDMPGSVVIATTADGNSVVTDRVKIGTRGNVILNNSGVALSTTNTHGFTYIPSMPGAPTGVPAETPTGAAPMVVDTTGSKLYVYIGGAWKSCTLT